MNVEEDRHKAFEDVDNTKENEDAPCVAEHCSTTENLTVKPKYTSIYNCLV